MPIVRIEYKKEDFSKDTMQLIATKLQEFSAEVTGYEPKDISVLLLKIKLLLMQLL